MRTSDYDYELPEGLIARYPTPNRGTSRMLVLDRISGACEIKPFSAIVDYLNTNDLLVSNNTRVLTSRIYGEKKSAENAVNRGAKIEILLLAPDKDNTQHWNCFLKPRKRVKQGTIINLLKRDETIGEHQCVVEQLLDDGSSVVSFNGETPEFIMENYGVVPIPPYFNRKTEAIDNERYQTVFAKHNGAVAAPTAGLHFTDDILDEIKKKGVRKAEVTLHVGAGTFKPVSTENLLEHKMHEEQFILTEEVAQQINTTHKNGNKVLAIGTTTVRVLESCAKDDGNVIAQSRSTEIFLHPPYTPKSVDMLLTNFHLPKSTLIMLVSTFADREKILNAYDFAIANKLSFYSYGDCMLII
jgi:S-adenosylmethionine:tRNA ribosyltransferase-isomerase